jgi:hypothetical protein
MANANPVGMTDKHRLYEPLDKRTIRERFNDNMFKANSPTFTSILYAPAGYLAYYLYQITFVDEDEE